MQETVQLEAQDIKVGHILWLREDQIIPADCLVLQTSNQDGSCMISTGQLDGERALKPKFALPETQVGIDSGIDSSMKIFCCKPNPDLFHFDGMTEVAIKGGYELRQLRIENFVPRGSILRNSVKGVLGLVLYTGSDTKLAQNQGKLKFKKSNLDLTLNKIYIV